MWVVEVQTMASLVPRYIDTLFIAFNDSHFVFVCGCMSTIATHFRLRHVHHRAFTARLEIASSTIHWFAQVGINDCAGYVNSNCNNSNNNTTNSVEEGAANETEDGGGRLN